MANFLGNLMHFCAYVTIKCNFAIISAIFLKKRFWADILCNLLQFCAYVAIQCNFAIITALFLKKKVLG